MSMHTRPMRMTPGFLAYALTAHPELLANLSDDGKPFPSVASAIMALGKLPDGTIFRGGVPMTKDEADELDRLASAYAAAEARIGKPKP